MDLNFLAIVVHSDQIKNKKKGRRGGDASWNPDLEGTDYMPNFMAVWADPFWTGLHFYKEMGITMPSGYEKCSIFLVSGRMLPMQPDPILITKPTVTEASICNSLKIHFFKESIDVQKKGTREETEIRRDFCFSSSVPLISPQGVEGGPNDNNNNMRVYGVVNYNVHDESCHTLKNFRLIIADLEPTLLLANCSIPRRVLSIPGPTPQHHQEVLDVANWVTSLMDYTCPEIDSNLKNIRTFPRDACNTLLFLNLPDLFVLEKFLPPSLATYMLCNSLILNCISPFDFANTLQALPHHAASLIIIEIPDILRVLRDTIAGMSMCIYEGKYWADKSLGQATEDQPFPLSFLPGNRVFQKDDCEGRITQAQELVKLLRRMYKASLFQGLEVFIDKMLSIPSHVSRLDLNRQTLRAIVLGCIYLGKLLQEKTIEVHTVVGDVCFSAFSSSSVEADNLKKSGHSFGVIIYDDKKSQQQHCSILEATGWERTRLPTDIPITEGESNFLKALCKDTTEKNIPILLCGHLSIPKENKVYKYMYMGNDCIFFKFPDKTKKNSFPMYGPGLDLFKQRVNRFADLKKGETSVGMFRISIMEFLREMASIEKNGPSPTSPWKSLRKENVKGAAEILYKNKKIRARMPYIRRCLTTPTKTQDEFRALMGLWAIIPQNVIPTRTTPCAGILFSMHADDNFGLSDVTGSSSSSLQGHNFMRSTIFRYTTTTTTTTTTTH